MVALLFYVSIQPHLLVEVVAKQQAATILAMEILAVFGLMFCHFTVSEVVVLQLTWGRFVGQYFMDESHVNLLILENHPILVLLLLEWLLDVILCCRLALDRVLRVEVLLIGLEVTTPEFVLVVIALEGISLCIVCGRSVTFDFT